MFLINDDMSIYVTRGDSVFFTVRAEENGEQYIFRAGDVLRFKAFSKKDCEDVVLSKDFPVEADTTSVNIILTKQDTKIREIISKPKDYWYEVELNPFTNPQTIIGYDDDGAKIFRLFPEGADLEDTGEGGGGFDPEDFPLIDEELDLTSPRPVQNQAIARAIVALANRVKNIKGQIIDASTEVIEHCGLFATLEYDEETEELNLRLLGMGEGGEGSGGISADELADAIETYFAEHPLIDGTTITLRSQDGCLQYSTDFVAWTNLFALSELKGDKGDKGDTGEQGVSGVYVGSGEMPEGYNVQIDPSGEVEGYYTADEIDAMFGAYVTEVAELIGGDA